EDVVAELRTEPAVGDEVDLAPEQRLQPLLHLEQVKVSDGAVELDEQVHVATGASLVARNGAEDRERRDAERLQLPDVGGDDLQGSLASHTTIIDGSPTAFTLPGTHLV